MKAFVLDSDSWHFKLSNYGSRRIWSDEETDICEYTHAVLCGAGTMAAVGVAAAFGIAWVGGSIYNIYDMIANGAALMPWTGVLLVLLFSFGVAAGIITYREWSAERNRNQPEPEPGFIKLAYRKVKNKTCARINFK